MNMPEQKKLVLKGNVPAKLEAKGVDASKLYHFIATGIELDIDTELESIATKFNDALYEEIALPDGSTTTKATIFDQVNGEGYCKNWVAQALKDAAAELQGTAVQGRAFKQTVVDNTPNLEMTDFESDGKAAKTKPTVANPFASVM